MVDVSNEVSVNLFSLYLILVIRFVLFFSFMEKDFYLLQEVWAQGILCDFALMQ